MDISQLNNISRRGIEIDSIVCPICNGGAESSCHIFFQCNLVRQLARKISSWWNVDYVDVSSYEELYTWLVSLRFQANLKAMFEGIFYCLWWSVWMFRNKILFEKDTPSQARIFDNIENDTIVEETPMINVDESDSGNDSEPSVVVTKGPKAQSSKRKRNDDKEAQEEEYEIYERTIKERAPIWQHFHPVRVKRDGLRRALCKFCNKTLTAHDANGTSSLQTWKHDESRIKKALINMFVVAESPFKFVEHDVFVEYTKACNGRFVLPSRHKLSKDVSKYYLDERTKDISSDLLKCIVGWGIKNVMTMTVDNAPSNDKALNYLIKKLPNAKIYDGGKHFHIRCMAHILNLIVKEGLKEKNYHVDCVANVVKYIRYSSQRINNFKRCMEEVNLESNRFLCGECPTRWNSKHDMLKIACSLRDVFFKYELDDDCYNRDLERVSEHSYFGVCEGVVEFLEKFKPKIELISSSSKPLAHIFFREILDIDKHLCYWATKPEFCFMVDDMVRKYNKYWGKFDELNDYMYFATILDPTMKQHLVSHGFKKMLKYNMSSESPLPNDSFNAMVREMLKEVMNRMGVLFQTYKTRFDTVVSKSSSKKTKNQQSCKSYVGDNTFLDDFLNLEDSGSIEMDTELTRHLNELRIKFTNILAIQITTVASESAFSTRGRVLDPYRTNLSYAVVEALICTQDWVRKSKKAIIDDIDDLLNDDDVAKDIEEGVAKQNAKGKGMGVTQD
ncbi:zinc finger BED domain-containing protein RICESLEEPER 2 [Tanacetum coccineum]